MNLMESIREMLSTPMDAASASFVTDPSTGAEEMTLSDGGKLVIRSMDEIVTVTFIPLGATKGNVIFRAPTSDPHAFTKARNTGLKFSGVTSKEDAMVEESWVMEATETPTYKKGDIIVGTINDDFKIFMSDKVEYHDELFRLPGGAAWLKADHHPWRYNKVLKTVFFWLSDMSDELKDEVKSVLKSKGYSIKKVENIYTYLPGRREGDKKMVARYNVLSRAHGQPEYTPEGANVMIHNYTDADVRAAVTKVFPGAEVELEMNRYYSGSPLYHISHDSIRPTPHGDRTFQLSAEPQYENGKKVSTKWIASLFVRSSEANSHIYGDGPSPEIAMRNLVKNMNARAKESTNVTENSSPSEDLQSLQDLLANPDEDFAKANYGSVEAYKKMLQGKIERLSKNEAVTVDNAHIVNLKASDKLRVQYGSIFVNGRPFEMTDPDESQDWPKAVTPDGKLLTWFKGRAASANTWKPEEIMGYYTDKLGNSIAEGLLHEKHVTMISLITTETNRNLIEAFLSQNPISNKENELLDIHMEFKRFKRLHESGHIEVPHK